MRNYYRLMLGQGGVYLEQAVVGGFIGVDFDIKEDLTGKLPTDWREFNKTYIPRMVDAGTSKSKIGAGLACGAVWTVCKGIQKGDWVLTHVGDGAYRIAEVTGDYQYAPSGPLPHRRPVTWLPHGVQKAQMSQQLKNSIGAINTVSTLSSHGAEIEALAGGQSTPVIVATDPTVEDPSEFALEKHLEDFLVANWAQTVLGQAYEIFSENGQPVGKQYPTDTGPLDILAVKKDGSELLVVELKKGRASDVVVGQVLRYIGFVNEELAEPHQKVRGMIIALEDDQKLRRAISAIGGLVDFYRYRVKFELIKSS